MKLTLENIGKVKHAEIDLGKDLIVLCGPNNTGKTYVAYAVFGLFRNHVSLNGILNVTEEELRDGIGEITLRDFYLGRKKRIFEHIELGFKKFLPNLFATSISTFPNTTVHIYTDDTDDPEFISRFEWWAKEIGKYESAEIKLRINRSKELPFWEILLPDFNETRGVGHVPFRADGAISYLVHSSIFGQTNIAPAERIAINIFNKELAERRVQLIDELLDSEGDKSAFELLYAKASRYPVPIRDNINIANGLDAYQNEIGAYAGLADQIEEDILFGKLSIGEFGEVLFAPNDLEKKIGIHLTGSVVKSLASIVFYLRHIAKPGDFYIIDEPELTLHPDNQRKIARILVRMVNVGIKVMMSTHSDYIIRELNNLMMLNTPDHSKKVRELMGKYGYAEAELLDHKRVGAYIFGEDVKPLEVNETGFEVKTIDDEINRLNESSMDIFLSLHG
jgi:hypothetical protein